MEGRTLALSERVLSHSETTGLTACCTLLSVSVNLSTAGPRSSTRVTRTRANKSVGGAP